MPLVSDFPDSILRAELSRRNEIRGSTSDRVACGSKEKGAYNTQIHVLALFLILVLSTLGNVYFWKRMKLSRIY